MAINRVDFPTVPNPVAGDWALLVELMKKGFQNVNSPVQIDGTNVSIGATFQIGGVIYYADADTAITGTASPYVKITPNVADSGATADAAYITDLTGILWYPIENGYYDISGNIVIFDEAEAIRVGALATLDTKFGRLWDKTKHITVSTSAPSGGYNGDIWLRI